MTFFGNIVYLRPCSVICGPSAKPGRSGTGGKARKDEGCDVVESRGMVSLNLSAVLPKPIKFISGSYSKRLGISSLLAM